MEKLNNLLTKTKEAANELAVLSEDIKNKVLLSISKSLIDNSDIIIEANKVDVNNAINNNISQVMVDRLSLSIKKIEDISNAIIDITKLKDPIGEIIESYEHNNKMIINKVRVPFGVICAIYESRPNVTVDIACLCLKTGNACVLRGGKEAINTNKILVQIMKSAVKDYINSDSITLIEDTDRSIVLDLIQNKKYIDLVVPRGGKKLIDFVVGNAKVPYIETGAGNCHLYVDDEADFNKALKVIVNAKVSRPSVCNAIESILVNEKIANNFLPLLKEELDKFNVQIRGCEKSINIIDINLATEEDYYQEYNDYIVSLKIIKDTKEAIKHINKYGTKHSDCIITENKEKAEMFLNGIDSACVYVNASTRFSDGGEFGFGAELGISTQKLHARGPMGLKEMTTYKYKIYGEGQVR